MTPLNDYVLLQKIDRPAPEHKPGIILTLNPTDTNEPVYQVLGVGEQIDSALQEGEYVYIRPFGGRNLKIDDVDYIIAKYEEIIGIKNG